MIGSGAGRLQVLPSIGAVPVVQHRWESGEGLPARARAGGAGPGEGGAAVLADAQTGLPMEGPAAGRGLSGPTSQTA